MGNTTIFGKVDAADGGRRTTLASAPTSITTRRPRGATPHLRGGLPGDLRAPRQGEQVPDHSHVSFELSEGIEPLPAPREAWDRLAAQRPSPFLTPAWIRHWVGAQAPDRALCATLRGPGGELLAGG